MPTISQHIVNGVPYSVMDAQARADISNLKNLKYFYYNNANRLFINGTGEILPLSYHGILSIELYPEDQVIPSNTELYLIFIENMDSPNNKRVYFVCDVSGTRSTCAQIIDSQTGNFTKTYITEPYSAQGPTYTFKVTIDWNMIPKGAGSIINTIKINKDLLQTRTTPLFSKDLMGIKEKPELFYSTKGIPEYYYNAIKGIYLDPISSPIPSNAELNLWFFENNSSNKRLYIRVGNTIVAQIYDETSGAFTKTYTTTQYQTNTTYTFKVTVDWSKAPAVGIQNTDVFINKKAIEAYDYLPYEPGYIWFTVPVNQTVANGDDQSLDLEDSESIVNVECCISLPDSYTQDGKPSKLLMICHGAGEGISRNLPQIWPQEGLTYGNIVGQFKDAGWAVFDCNGYDNTSDGATFWGAPKGVECWRKAYEYVVKHYNVSKNFCIYGFSMGGLTTMSLAFSDFPNLCAIGMGSPVLDLKAVWDANETVQNQIKAGYGMTNWSEAKTAGSNPLKSLVEIDGTEYCIKKLPPIKIWYGSLESGDSYVSKEKAQRFVTALQNSNSYAIYREVSGAGHGVCSGQYEDINTEFLYWLNRFAN